MLCVLYFSGAELLFPFCHELGVYIQWSNVVRVKGIFIIVVKQIVVKGQFHYLVKGRYAVRELNLKILIVLAAIYALAAVVAYLGEGRVGFLAGQLSS